MKAKVNRNLVFAVLAVFIVALLQIMAFRTKYDKIDVQKALESCLEEVESSCKQLWEYATTLERENSKLVYELKECENESR